MKLEINWSVPIHQADGTMDDMMKAAADEVGAYFRGKDLDGPKVSKVTYSFSVRSDENSVLPSQKVMNLGVAVGKALAMWDQM